MFISVDFPGEGPQLDSVDVILDNREWTTLGEEFGRHRVSLEVTTSDGMHTRDRFEGDDGCAGRPSQEATEAP